MNDKSIVRLMVAHFHLWDGRQSWEAGGTLRALMLAVAVVVAQISLRLAGLAGDGCDLVRISQACRDEQEKRVTVEQAPPTRPVEVPSRVSLNREGIVAWTVAHFQLGDKRRSRALGDMVWGLIQAGVVAFAAIGRKMAGPAEEASNITRVYRFCHNKLVDVVVVQQTLLSLLVSRAALVVEGVGRVAVAAIDWHSYDNGETSGLRVSLMTGSRAIPLLWYEFKTSELKGKMTGIEVQVVRDLIRWRPEGGKWLLLLDAGFKSPEILDLLEEAGYYVVRSASRVVINSGRECCWTSIGKLPVAVGELVEFGWVYWNSTNPRWVRLVAGRLYDLRPPRRGRRTPEATRRKNRHPGLCPVITNLPMQVFSSVAVLRLYARRFEIEHSFRDIKNATLGMDMEHVHLLEASTYSRLMCIVALAETILWLAGSEAEAAGLHKRLTPSRPKDGHRVLSLRNVGFLSLQRIHGGVSALLDVHLPAATTRLFTVIGRTWKDIKQRLIAVGAIHTKDQCSPLPRNRHKTRCRVPCTSPATWPLEPDPSPMAA